MQAADKGLQLKLQARCLIPLIKKGRLIKELLTKLSVTCINVSVQALFVPTVLASYASMVTHNILDPAVLVSHATDTQLPAQVPFFPNAQSKYVHVVQMHSAVQTTNLLVLCAEATEGLHLV